MKRAITLQMLFVAAVFVLLFSNCSDPQRDNPNDPGGTNYQGHRSSSSSGGGSSSSSNVIPLCGGFPYTSSQFCHENGIYDKCGGIVTQPYNPDTHYCSNGTVKSYSGTISYGGQTYKTIVIGSQTWMAENLNYNCCGECYDNEPENCAKYGRLYNWQTAKTVCPTGWHLPSDEEWQTLVDFAGGKYITGKKLKATSGWNSYNGTSSKGTDDYGFSALPGGGYGLSDGSFSYVGYGDYGYWWSATEDDSDYAYYRVMGFNYSHVYRDLISKSFLFSVRCLQD
jgi:uncharacterized protein (TIGR02145 family)